MCSHDHAIIVGLLYYVTNRVSFGQYTNYYISIDLQHELRLSHKNYIARYFRVITSNSKPLAT